MIYEDAKLEINKLSERYNKCEEEIECMIRKLREEEWNVEKAIIGVIRRYIDKDRFDTLEELN